MNTPTVLDWTAAFAAGPAAVGGKAWNLARLSRYGFPVPVGGVLPASAYAGFMAAPALAQLQRQLQPITPEEAATSYEPLLAEMQAAIRRTPLPPGVVNALHDFLDRHNLLHVPLAVRSSATAEDGARASFAGIHGTRLFQVGLEAVIDSVRECYASLWTPRAVAYRRRLGLGDDEVLCAVVLCRMVGAHGDPTREPVAAGVAFSCDPRTGRRDVITIAAVPGLGEALVSGRVNPEHIVVEAGWQPNVVQRQRGDAAGEVLREELAARLAHLVQRVEWALGDGQQPQDVEWAYDGTDFWLLQARPVTRLPRYTFPGAEQLPLVWSNANLKDALPGVLSPYAWSITLAILRHNLFAPHRAAGYPVPPGLEVCRRFAGRAYFDFTSLFWAFYDGLGITAAEFNRSMGGHQPELPVAEPDPMKGPRARRRNQARVRLFRAILRLDKRLPAEIRAVMDTARRYRNLDLSGESMDSLRQRLTDLVAVSYEFGPKSMLANTSAAVWHNLLEKLLKNVAPAEAASLASDLVAGSGQVASAEHGYRLLDLAAQAAADEAARALFSAGPVTPAAWRRLPAGSPFRAELERFLHDFGHRGVYEVDIANPRWIEDPTYVLEQVRFLLEAGVPAGFREAGARRRAQALRTVARRGWFLLPLIRWAARRASHAAALREGAKSALVALLEPYRRILLETGRRMEAAGVVAEASDIFYLTWVDVDAFMRGWWDGTGARALIQDRHAQRQAWLSQQPPDVIVDTSGTVPVTVTGSSIARQIQQKVPGGERVSRAERVLRGTAVAAGKATGPARILRHPAEGHRLNAGEVLVAPSTDPGWTPLFMRAAAIVMEVGGYHSHGAIVAREFGIPAVANVPGVLATLQDGETVTVNGDEGTVMRH